jgi:hypothetical protein
VEFNLAIASVTYGDVPEAHYLVSRRVPLSLSYELSLLPAWSLPYWERLLFLRGSGVTGGDVR